MSDIVFNFSTSGYETIQEDAEKELKRIFSAPVIGNILSGVRADMVENLKKHIQEDVYDKYKQPRVYKRRSKDRSLGIPLIDVEATGQSRLFGYINHGANTAGISIDYTPTGEHKTRKWSGVNEDELIRRIETGTPPYKWRPNFDPLERPFWQNFVEEQVDRGAIMDSFIREARLHGEEITAEGGGVIREPEDGSY